MSNINPTKPYIYQPDPPCAGPIEDQRIYGVGGPGAEHLRGCRFTRARAEEMLIELLERREEAPDVLV